MQINIRDFAHKFYRGFFLLSVWLSIINTRKAILSLGFIETILRQKTSLAYPELGWIGKL